MSDDPKAPRDSEDDARRSATPPDDESLSPDQEARWRRPEQRFPALPDEVPPEPATPLKQPLRRAPPPDPEVRARNRGRNLITLFFFLATIAVIAYFVIVWQNPYTVLNPLAPPTPLPVVITATFTATATLTPTSTMTPSPTFTPSETPTQGPTLTFTAASVQAVGAPEVTAVVTEDTTNYRFSLQRGRVIYLTNPDQRGGCNWSSIAGSVVDFDGSALSGYGVHVIGEQVDQTIGTGTATGFGPGGFEVPLGTTARDAQYSVQLIDPQGNAVSPVYPVETKSDCQYNIAALHFVATSAAS